MYVFIGGCDDNVNSGISGVGVMLMEWVWSGVNDWDVIGLVGHYTTSGTL